MRGPRELRERAAPSASPQNWKSTGRNWPAATLFRGDSASPTAAASAPDSTSPVPPQPRGSPASWLPSLIALRYCVLCPLKRGDPTGPRVTGQDRHFPGALCRPPTLMGGRTSCGWVVPPGSSLLKLWEGTQGHTAGSPPARCW